MRYEPKTPSGTLIDQKFDLSMHRQTSAPLTENCLIGFLSLVSFWTDTIASASYNGAQYIAESPVEGTVLTATFPPGWSGGVNGAKTDVLFRESSNVRNMPNTLTLTFVPNAPFFPGSKITVIGVTGTQSQVRECPK